MGSTPSQETHSLLIVDDEQAIVQALSTTMQAENFKTIGFSDPREAYEWGKKNPFDLLITDLRMSPFTGLELHEKLKIYYPDLLTILMTGYSSVDSAQQAISSSIYAYVSKPFEIAQMKELVHRALDKKELLDRNRELVDQQQDLIEKLLVANKKLKKLDKMKNDFVSTVSHELRTPVTSIRNVLYNFSEGVAGEVTEKQKHYLEMMEQDTGRLEHLINDILDLSHLESGRYELKVSRFRVGEVFESALKVVEGSLKLKEMQIEKEMAPNVESIEMQADQGKLEQVFVNLLSNAIKYSDKGKRIWVQLSAEEKSLRGVVKDEGVGIAPEDHQRVFQRFERAGESAKGGIKGTGLGLAIVKKILDFHRGSIRLESTPGKGSTFTFEVPLIQLEEGPKET